MPDEVIAAEITEPVIPQDEAGKKAHEHHQQQQQRLEGKFQLDPKFKTVEELQNAYHELQRKQGGQPEDPPPPVDTGTDEEDVPALDTGKQPTTPTPPKFDVEKYNEEVMMNETLSDESRKELVAHGIPEVWIDNYLAGVQASVQQAQQALFAAAGGQQEYAAMVRWANANLDEEERVAIDEAIKASARSRDSTKALVAIRGLAARYRASAAAQTGIEGVDGGALVQPFKSLDEMRKAMADPRYKSDDNYRREVAERLRHAPRLLG